MSKQCLYLILALVILGLVSPALAADIGKGKILFEWFDGTRSTTNFAQITDGRSWRYPDYPTVSQWRTSFDGIDGRGEWYVTRVRGYVHPPADGDYTFWITSDDQSQLYLSTDEDPANKVMISQVTGYSGATEWTKFPEQKSAAIALKAGKKYYIEALHRDGTGGDRLRVAWTGPVIGETQVIIAGQYLSPWIRPGDLMAQDPDPADGEQGVYDGCIEWGRGLASMPVYDTIYFGTDPNTWSSNRLSAAQMEACYPVEPGVTYYWRVDQVEADGTVHQGQVWTFTTKPLAASEPNPSDGARGISTDAVLLWEAGMDAMEHEVFLGENKADVAAGAPGVSRGMTYATSMNVGGLKDNTLYHWRVDTIDWFGVKTQGPVWSFRTLSSAVADPDLIGWWKLDETSGTIAVDYSGHGNHGVLLAGINGGLQPVTGIAGGALEFDGMDDIIDIGKNAADLGIDGAKPRTVTAWVYTHSFKEGGIFETGARVAAQNFSLRTRGGNNQWRVQLYGTGNDADFTYTSLNTWVHFALVYDGATSTCYANGTVVATGPRTLDTTATLAFQIGVYNNYRFDGVIDDVRLYSKALTQAEVQAIVTRADPLQAWAPSPTIGAVTDAVRAVPLTWAPGDGAAQHDVFLTTDSNVIGDVTTADTTGVYRGRVDVNSYTPDPVLDWNDTYYWRIDEITADGDVVQGKVWNFTLTEWLMIDDFEVYTNNSPNRIFQTWLDSYGYSADEFFPVAYAGNGTGAGVGHDIWSAESAYLNGNIAERGLRHGGAQSMPLYYDNAASPFYSETERSWTSAQPWAADGASELILHVRGNPRKFVKASESSFSLSGAGVDIWGTADQFAYAHKTLTGNGTIIARVTSNGFGTNRWAKGGVMIRADNDPAAVNAFTAVTGGDGDGGTFQWRPTFGVASLSSRTLTGIAPPYWVRLDRQGNTFTGYLSVDGQNWVQEGTSSIDIAMTDPVLVGVAVTSHAANQLREFEFDNITVTGSVTGAWTVEDIGVVQPSNEDAMPLYVIVQDWNNRVSSPVVHPDANILQSEDWSPWRIPFTDFAPANLGAVRKIIIGVGSRTSPKTGGAGMIYIDNIGRTRPAQ